jgi:hypothetical protein
LVFSGVVPDVPPEGDDGVCGFFFGCSVELPGVPLGLLEGLLAVPPLPAGRLALLSLLQPDKSVPAKASAKTTGRIRFMRVYSFRTN